jgi:hypothetical protein
MLPTTASAIEAKVGIHKYCYESTCEPCLPIIATIGKTIEGIERIEIPDEADIIINNHLNIVDGFDVYSNRAAVREAMIMYAATKTYSEEDIKGLLLEIFKRKSDPPEVLSIVAKKYLKSLQPVPIEVTLEYEEKYKIGKLIEGVGLGEDMPHELVLSSPIKVVEVKYG